MKIRAVIVEDEPLAQEILEEYLSEISGISVVGKYFNGYEGLKGIQELRPDLIFLDINLPKITGFEMLELLDEPPHVVFITAYDNFAIKAFEVNAVDYLLKPFSKERLKAAVGRATHLLETDEPRRLQSLSEEGSFVEGALGRVVVKTGHKIDIIPVSDIHRISAEDDYVAIHTLKGRFLKLKSMKYFERALDPALFFRVHRSHMVNLSLVERIEPYEKEKFRLRLKSGVEVPVSKSGMIKLKAALE